MENSWYIGEENARVVSFRIGYVHALIISPVFQQNNVVQHECAIHPRYLCLNDVCIPSMFYQCLYFERIGGGILTIHDGVFVHGCLIASSALYTLYMADVYAIWRAMKKNPARLSRRPCARDGVSWSPSRHICVRAIAAFEVKQVILNALMTCLHVCPTCAYLID